MTGGISQAARDAALKIAAWIDVDWETLHEDDRAAPTAIVTKAIADERERVGNILAERAAWERAQIATSKSQRERLCFANAAHALEEAATAARATGGEGGR